MCSRVYLDIRIPIKQKTKLFRFFKIASGSETLDIYAHVDGGGEDERRVQCAQTQERGPPSTLVEIFKNMKDDLLERQPQ